MYWLSLERLLWTLDTIVINPRCRCYVIGYSSGQVLKRLHGYRHEFQHAVVLANNLPKEKAAFLEWGLQDLIKNNDKRSALYRKYDPTRRLLPYSPNYGRNGPSAEALVHSVYVAWRCD